MELVMLGTGAAERLAEPVSALALPAWLPCRVKPFAGTLPPWWTTESCWIVVRKYRVPRRDSVARWHTWNTSC